MTDFDVTTLRGRRADRRWNRTAVGDLLERLTWSRPDQEAIVGWTGAYGDPAFARVTYRQADEAATRVANALLAAGLEPADRVGKVLKVQAARALRQPRAGGLLSRADQS